MLVVVQGIIVEDPGAGCVALCLPISAVSPDINGDLVVDLIDLAAFAVSYTAPPKPYVACLDYNCDGTLIDLIDFALFALHYTHAC